ncbi:hypothetical protein TWF730_010232 [Orbilia blumenaviensis]|uniref:Uncharacterized protein n=1 Tax=Orbilia blumenaviensis TaxID=1796055 RepID=A0AAV9UNG2_9PEZI
MIFMSPWTCVVVFGAVSSQIPTHPFIQAEGLETKMKIALWKVDWMLDERITRIDEIIDKTKVRLSAITKDTKQCSVWAHIVVGTVLAALSYIGLERHCLIKWIVEAVADLKDRNTDDVKASA